MEAQAKRWGAYYTSELIARHLVNWAIRDGSDRVLEPSFGGGSFLDAAFQRIQELGGASSNLFAVELRPETFEKYVSRGELLPENCHLGDFLALNPFPVNVVVGNPPYIRLRKLGVTDKRNAIDASTRAGVTTRPDGSLWMPFVAHATTFLAPGGRMAFVLPFEMTYVQYALPLWKFLGNHFGHITVARIHQPLFPDIDEETVLLMADRRGHSTEFIDYRLYSDVGAMLRGAELSRTAVAISDILDEERAFSLAVVSRRSRELLSSLAATERLIPIGHLSKFEIGYVAGDKTFFHPSAETVSKFGLPEASLFPSIVNSRQLRGMGLRTRLVDPTRASRLYYPHNITAADLNYIAFGEEQGVSQRYKCRIRKPWYQVPGVRRPDLILSVFADAPLLLANDGKFFASNSLLCGVLHNRETVAINVAALWYNSITKLSCEVEVHSLGGGVFVLIPGEANQILIPNPEIVQIDDGILEELDAALRSGDVSLARQLGDEAFLRDGLGLSSRELATLRQDISELEWWRRGARLEYQRPDADSTETHSETSCAP